MIFPSVGIMMLDNSGALSQAAAHRYSGDYSMHRRMFCTGAFALTATATRLGGIPALPANQFEWDREGQLQRRRQIYSLHQASVGPLFDSNGNWMGSSTPPIGRERLWNCLSFVDSPET